ESLQNHQLKIESNNISVVDFPHGIHCTLPIPYDWKVLSSILQSYVLSHSPGFQVQNQSFEMELGDFKVNPSAKFRVLPLDAKKNFVNIEIEVTSAKSDVEKLKISLPLSQFDFRFLNSELSPSEEWMIERWVNHNLKLQIINRSGKSFVQAGWPLAR
ncbi:MAG: hypothetical protein H7326_10680, partial [Bdellovibrionaceae bacterium]|nr:hypothetical protein [Pseudobdellovibrionaceae bacterium]